MFKLGDGRALRHAPSALSASGGALRGAGAQAPAVKEASDSSPLSAVGGDDEAGARTPGPTTPRHALGLGAASGGLFQVQSEPHLCSFVNARKCNSRSRHCGGAIPTLTGIYGRSCKRNKKKKERGKKPHTHTQSQNDFTQRAHALQS